jgi:hypothetical protein
VTWVTRIFATERPVPKQPDVLKELLSDAESELSRRLREACDAEARGISTESTKEIRKLEDALLAAAVAAQQTIDVRRRMRERDNAEEERQIAVPSTVDRAEGERAHPTVGSTDSEGDTEQTMPSRLREFTDASGRPWRAWPVTPGLDRRSGSDRRFLGDFEEGWICFEALDSSARRRLPCREPNWGRIQTPELQRLLERAIDAPVRKPHRLDAPPSADPGNLPA